MSACPGINPGVKILVVDDDKNAAKLLKLNLEEYGFTIITAISGKDGLSKSFSELPHAIILDVRMPDLNGWQVCERLKKDPRTAAIPVIFLTAYSQTTDFEKSKKLGADLFLNKPLDPEELAQNIKGVLDRNNEDLSGEEKQRL